MFEVFIFGFLSCWLLFFEFLNVWSAWVFEYLHVWVVERLSYCVVASLRCVCIFCIVDFFEASSFLLCLSDWVVEVVFGVFELCCWDFSFLRFGEVWKFSCSFCVVEFVSFWCLDRVHVCVFFRLMSFGMLGVLICWVGLGFEVFEIIGF